MIPGLNLGSILGNLGGIVKPQATEQLSQPYPTTLSHSDLWLTPGSDIVVVGSQEILIAEYVVPAQQTIRWGYGRSINPDNQGYAYMAIYDDTATNSVLEEGTILLRQSNARRTKIITVAEIPTQVLRGDLNDRTKKYPLPEQFQFPLVGEDSKLEIWFISAASDTIVEAAIGTAAGNDIWQFPITVYQ